MKKPLAEEELKNAIFGRFRNYTFAVQQKTTSFKGCFYRNGALLYRFSTVSYCS